MSQASNEDNSFSFDPAQEQGAESIQSPHDRLLNRALMQMESAQELIRSHLPSEFV